MSDEFIDCGGQDLNLRPPAYEAGELPDCSTPLIEYARFEL